jgi:FtsP/CotA-like multicopper oxidase with cupredoxin domain
MLRPLFFLPLLALALAGPALAKKTLFENPPFLTSVDGVLQTTLTAGPAEVLVGKKRVTSNVFNGTYTPPVFRLMQGDTLRVHQVNNMTDWQLNFHGHGLAVSPQLNGDNVFVRVFPGEEFDTEIFIPDSHQSGMFWYHPHVHGFVNNTISNGMTSALIIGDILAPFPELEGITERVLLLKDMKIKKKKPVDDPDPAGKSRRTINGLWKPQIDIAPGELQFWRIGNVGANIFFDLVMKDVTFYILAIDGNLQNQLIETDELVMPPGRRYEVLVRGPEKRRKSKLKTLKFNTGPDGDAYPGQVMAKLKVSKTPVANPIPLPAPEDFPPVVDLREEIVDQSRTIVFDDTDDPDVFVIDGQVYDENRVDQTVQLGDLEEWTLQNASAEFHVFHIHQGDFQVISIDGEPQPFTGYMDTVNIPVATDSGPGEVVMRIRFDPPIIVGEYVYHCHIVQHEDQGMMANVVVQDAVAKHMVKDEPPDLIAQVMSPVDGNFWCL